MFANFTSIAHASVNPFSKSMEMVSCGQAFSDFKKMFEIIESEDNGSEETIVDVISEMKKLCSGTESEKTETGTEANVSGDLFKSRFLTAEEVESLPSITKSESVDESSVSRAQDVAKIKEVSTAAAENISKLTKELSAVAAENIAKLTAMDNASEDDSVVEEIRRYLDTTVVTDEKVLADTGSSGKNWEIKETGTEEAPTVLINIQAAAESANVSQAEETPMQYALRNAKRGKK